MPLSPPQERELLHSRDIVLRGYQRADGLYDIEAQLTDAKSYGFANHDRGYVRAGEPIHGMWLRLTVDEQRNIIACEAASDYTPYGICPRYLSDGGAELHPARWPADQAWLPQGGRQALRRHAWLHSPARTAAADSHHRLSDDRPRPREARSGRRW